MCTYIHVINLLMEYVFVEEREGKSEHELELFRGERE